MKRTLVLGATDNPDRYAYKAIHSLLRHNHDFVPVGIKKGTVGGKEIINSKELQKDIDTVTLYVGPQNQREWYDYLINTKPKRIIFNPGAENDELKEKAEAAGIETIEGCTLVMLSIGTY